MSIQDDKIELDVNKLKALYGQKIGLGAKVQQLLETGTAEHDAKAGYILTEEFLKLYN